MSASSAVAVVPNTVIPLEAFRNSDFKFNGSYRQHNAALKYFRYLQEDATDPFNPSRMLRFPNDAPVQIATIRWQKGEQWAFDDTKMVTWSWKEMIAQLDETSMRIVVCGKNSRSCGLIGCYIAPRPHSYDHKRHKMLFTAEKERREVKLPVWDFVIERSDGTALRLHPQRSTTKVETFRVNGPAEPVEPPSNGHGGSWGAGAFKHYKNAQTELALRFDANKGQWLQPFKNQ